MDKLLSRYFERKLRGEGKSPVCVRGDRARENVSGMKDNRKNLFERVEEKERQIYGNKNEDNAEHQSKPQ